MTKSVEEFLGDIIKSKGKRNDKKGLENLQNIGYLITDEIYQDVTELKNARLYGKSPLSESDKKQGIISIGPFPIKQESYEGIIKLIEKSHTTKSEKNAKDTSIAAMLAPYKLQYEYFGTINEFDGVHIAEDDLINIIYLITFIYDIHNPIKTKSFFWIVPDYLKKCKIIETFNITDTKHIECWWNTRTKIIENVETLDLKNEGDTFMLPSTIFSLWSDYLTVYTSLCIVNLYSLGMKNRGYKKLNKEQVIEIMGNSIKEMYENEISSEPDKELLLAKLYRKNNIEFPNDVETLHNFLIITGFLLKEKVQAKTYYKVANLRQQKRPDEIFDIDKEMKRSFEMYKKNESIILDYMKPEEYINLTITEE